MSKLPVKTQSGVELEALSFSLQRQDKQSHVLQEVITAVIETKDEMIVIRDDIKRDVNELRDSITLNRHECSEIQVAVGRRAQTLTKELFRTGVSDDLFLAKLGHFRSAVYKRLKDSFNINRYYDIRRVDFNTALGVIASIELSNLKDYQLRLTPRQKEIAVMNNDDISNIS